MAIRPTASWLGAARNFGRKIEDLFALNRTAQEALQLVEERLRSIEDRLLVMEGEQSRLMTEARSAASYTATAVAASALFEAATRIAGTGRKRRIKAPSSAKGG